MQNDRNTEREAEAVIAVLAAALIDAHEALFSYAALQFEPTGSGGKTIDLIIKEAMRTQAAYRLRTEGAA